MYSLMKCPYCYKPILVPEIVSEYTKVCDSWHKNFKGDKIMWYENGETKTIQENKPIFAKNDKGTYILLPQIDEDYEIEGYNWFSIQKGRYDSCVFYQSAAEAIKSRSNDYDIYNGELRVDRI